MNIIFSGDRKSRIIAIGKKIKRFPWLGRLIKIALWDGYKSRVYLGTFLALTIYGGIANAGSIADDMGQYMQVNPHDSRGIQKMKQSYNNNVYLNQKSESDYSAHKNNMDTLSQISNRINNKPTPQFIPLSFYEKGNGK
ncbi:MAG: hypothetical protein A2W17_04280 [Planctomycetes bacterium RBG_16_41_13]|nr:MAG: hypothetical protein A2W17_04280 [Planctomycetes bacterium RBG_16_41_13]